MKKRVCLFFLSVGLVLFLCVGFVAGTGAGRGPAYRYLRVFSEVLNLIRGNYVDEVDDPELLRGAYVGVLSGLDSASGYLGSEEFARLQKEPQGPADPGMDVVKDSSAFVVVGVWPGTPAAKAGLSIGDRIWSIDGASTREMSLLQAMRRLSGAPGSEVSLQVYSGRERKRQDFRLRRVASNVSPFEARLEGPGVGYLRLRNLAACDRGAVGAALGELERKGARRLLLDLRGATRGGVEDAARIAGLWIGDGVVVRTQERGGASVEIKGRGPALCRLPTWVLVNGGTSGAPEILTAALHDALHARLLGDRTAGLGARQELIRLPGGDGLVLSVARYLAPGGSSWHGEGIHEDVAVPLDGSALNAADSEGAQLKRALEIVSTEEPAAKAA